MPAAHPLVGGQPVLKEVQGPPRPEDPPQLAQGGGHVGDGAQRPRGQGAVEAVVGKWQRLPVQTRPTHLDFRRTEPLAGQSPARVGRLDRGDPGDQRGIEGNVEPRAEADLDDLAGQTLTDPSPQRVQLRAAAR